MTTFLDRGFPIDDYTPHGYLANPHAFARSWSEGHGGNLRSTAVAVGFGWLYPWARGARTGAQLEIGIEHGGDPLVTRVDFDRLGLSAPHHSALLFEYAWDLDVLTCRARFVLVGEDELGLEVDVGRTPPPDPLPEPGRGAIPPPRPGAAPGEGSRTLSVAAVAWRRGG